MSIEMLSLRSVSQQTHGAEIARWEDFSRLMQTRYWNAIVVPESMPAALKSNFQKL